MSTRRPVPVLAALAILLCAPVASGYSLRRSGAGVVLVWQQPRQQVEIDTSGLSGLPGAAAAVRAAFETWLAAGAPLELDFAPSAGKAPVAFDGRNVVTWESDWKYTEEVVAMTVSVHKASAASVTETDIVCNGRAGWVTAPGTGEVNLFDVQNVLTHEVGQA